MKMGVIVNDVVVHGEKITSEQHLALHIALMAFIDSVTDDDDDFIKENVLHAKELERKIFGKTEPWEIKTVMNEAKKQVTKTSVKLKTKDVLK